MNPGVYQWSYENGSFEVELRSYNNVFYCSSYSASGSNWKVDGDRLVVNWKKYGDYEFKLNPSEPTLSGNLVGSEENWRKLTFVRPFTAEELALQGEFGAGSAWNFEYDGGSFEIQFFTDSYNHFHCPSYPAHSHWKMTDGTKIEINWGKYGIYTLDIDGTNNTMSGCKKGQPKNWRKASLIRSLEPEYFASAGHDHAHDH